MRESKKSEGGGAFKAPPPSDRIGLKDSTGTELCVYPQENTCILNYAEQNYCICDILDASKTFDRLFTTSYSKKLINHRAPLFIKY